MPLNILAWNNDIGPWYYFVGLRTEVMIKRTVGGIPRFLEDKLLQKHH